MDIGAIAGRPTTLRFRCFGGFDLLDCAAWRNGPSRKHGREFLEFLVVHPSAAISRDVLAEAFWPDTPLDEVSHRLHIAASGARNALRNVVGGVDAIKCSHGAYGWHPGIAVESEIAAFMACSKGGIADFEQGVELYSGELLAGETADWVVRLRLRFANQYIAMLGGLTDDALRHRRYERAIVYAELLVETDHAHEVATRSLMYALAKLGRFTHAIAAYNLLARYLEKNLGVMPGAHTQALRDAVAQGTIDPFSSLGEPLMNSIIPDLQAHLQWR